MIHFHFVSPGLLQSPLMVLGRLREHLNAAYVAYADNEGVFMLIRLLECDQFSWRFFLWREDPTSDVKVF